MEKIKLTDEIIESDLKKLRKKYISEMIVAIIMIIFFSVIAKMY